MIVINDNILSRIPFVFPKYLISELLEEISQVQNIEPNFSPHLFVLCNLNNVDR